MEREKLTHSRIKNYARHVPKGCDPTKCNECFAYKYGESAGWYCAIDFLTGRKPTEENGGFNEMAVGYMQASFEALREEHQKKNEPVPFMLCVSCGSVISENDIVMIPVEGEDGETEEREGCPVCGNVDNAKFITDHWEQNLFCSCDKVHDNSKFPVKVKAKHENGLVLEAVSLGWSNLNDGMWKCPECTEELGIKEKDDDREYLEN